MPRCHISLGGNTGEVAAAFGAALGRLRNTAGCTVVAVSRFHETAPVGNEAENRFLNAAAEIETSLDPFAFLDLLQGVEGDLGRLRTVRWGPRTIDLDLLFYGNEVIESPRLVVPHPAAWYRRFVLDPLAEIAPQFVHPIKRVTVQALRERLLERPLPVALAGATTDQKTGMIANLSQTFPAGRFFDWDQAPAGSAEPALIFWLGGTPFGRLPILPRLDATAGLESPADFVMHSLHAALGM
ncbi:MAG: 2-amino-4-hydroxy-6-hydroxymethyldihydropteridine diphosphokinase [Planctomycetia bacterium]|nr:2-amino-4-hydroxy-6-hydroxymethyldihydropteridine diphosphokinase [Planctomycetia bacterium]